MKAPAVCCNEKARDIFTAGTPNVGMFDCATDPDNHKDLTNAHMVYSFIISCGSFYEIR